jgi:hypothetical protein
MDKPMNVHLKLFLLLAAASALTGCTHSAALPAVDFVAVREIDLRSDRYPLPLTADARGQILMYLAAGGDKAGIDEGTVVTMVYPDAEQRWGELLATMQSPANVDADDLTNGTYRKWFQEEPVRQIIDASAQRPNVACPPYAVRQDRFVWIFECGAQGKLGKVFVQIAIAKREEN